MGQTAVSNKTISNICCSRYDHCDASQKRMFAHNKLFYGGKIRLPVLSFVRILTEARVAQSAQRLSYGFEVLGFELRCGQEILPLLQIVHTDSGAYPASFQWVQGREFNH